MKRTVSAGVLAGVALAVVALTGCQAGRDAATAQQYNPVDGRNVNVPAGASYPDPYIAVRDAVVVSNGKAGALLLTVVNNTKDGEVLAGATLNGKDVLMPAGPVDIAPGQSVNIGSDAGAVAGIVDLGVPPGTWAGLSLHFTNAGDSDFQVLVVPPGDEYVPDAEASVVDLFLNTAAAALPPKANAVTTSGTAGNNNP